MSPSEEHGDEDNYTEYVLALTHFFKGVVPEADNAAIYEHIYNYILGEDMLTAQEHEALGTELLEMTRLEAAKQPGSEHLH